MTFCQKASKTPPNTTNPRKRAGAWRARLLLLGHATANQLDECILECRFTLLHSLDLAAGSLDRPHHAPQRRIVRELKAEPVGAVLLQDAGGCHAIHPAQGVEQAAARTELKIDDRILLDALL